MKNPKGKVAIITGGGAGIGEAIGNELAASGVIVVLADVKEIEVQRAAQAIKAKGYAAEAAVLDVTNEKAVSTLIKQTVEKYGKLDYMFNNAGIAIGGDARDLAVDQWQKVLDVNLNGVMYGTVHAYKVMTEQGFGHIINTASATGLVPQPGNAPYATSKHAIVGMSLSLRAEGADLGVNVSTVCPGYVQTNIYKSMVVMKMSREKAASRLPSKVTSAADAAKTILNGVHRNKAIIIFPVSVRIAWRIYRYVPRLMESVWVKRMRDFRKYREA